MRRIVVLGAGFAGLWSAVGAARAVDEFGAGGVEIMVIDRSDRHSIRVRNYEADLSDTRVSLDDVLDPIGVRHAAGEVTAIHTDRKTVIYTSGMESLVVPYDRLIFALGSRVVRPNIPGLAAFGFDVDTYDAALSLNEHIAALPSREPGPGQYTVLVVGAGLTGIEAACEMPGKLRAAMEAGVGPSGSESPRVILADRQKWIGSDMGDGARPVIAEALEALGIETRVGVQLISVDRNGARFSTGEVVPAATVVWCAGMQAHPLTAQFPAERDRFGRLRTDSFLKINGLEAEFAAGDVATFPVDGSHDSVMSCQHGRPMGRFAGHNAVCDLLGRPMLPLRIDWYTTILDLGPWGAVCTEGWDRRVVSSGAAAKPTKETINRQRIYPPRTRDRREILDAAAPVVQAPPIRVG